MDDKEASTSEKKTAAPFKLERTLIGTAHGFIEIAERCVNGTLGTQEAREATRALSGVPAMVRVQLDALRIFEKGSEKARQQAARILELSALEQLEGPRPTA